MNVLIGRRPPFTNVVKPTDQLIPDDRKEEQFQRWRKRNMERMRAASVRSKVYEFSSKPVVVMAAANEEAANASQRPEQRGRVWRMNSKGKVSTSTSTAASTVQSKTRASLTSRQSSHVRIIKRLAPMNGGGSGSGSGSVGVNNTPASSSVTSRGASRKKKLTKTRPRAKSTPKLAKMVDTSSEDGDAAAKNKQGPPTNRSDPDEGFGSSTLESPKVKLAGDKVKVKVASGQRKEAFVVEGKKPGKQLARDGAVDVTLTLANETINDLIREIIGHSISEVTNEEKHLMQLRNM